MLLSLFVLTTELSPDDELPHELIVSGGLGDFLLVKEGETEEDGDLFGSFGTRGHWELLLPCELTASGDLGDFFLLKEREPEEDVDLFCSFETRGLGEFF